uniref:PDZ domain-containing protein n=1 Tax=Romanomermis culicivorax TaxID=13658 RepID=A0A915HRW4_ROMCU
YEEKQTLPDGTQQTFIYQTVEIVKKPGQSLGLYLREGFGHERSDGVFVSRLADGSDLAKSSCLKPGDEVLSVNNVGVTQMGIDDVVVIISIPMRLLLKTRFPKFPASRISPGEENMTKSTDVEATPSTSATAAKPVVVMKQMPREESVESGFTDDGGATLAQARPTPTAQTSLGAKLRQQESRGPSYDSLRRNISRGQENIMGHSTGYDDYGGKYTAYSRQIAMHTPRVLDGQGRLLEGPDIWHENCPGHSGDGAVGHGRAPVRQHQPQQTSPYQSTLSRTAYLPPPRLQTTAPGGGGVRATSQVDYGPAAALGPGENFYPAPSPENVPELITQPPFEALSELAINR